MSIETAISRLKSLFGDCISLSTAERALHAENEAYFPETLPDAVIYPTSTREVSEILRICHKEHCPVIAFGAGSALEGQHLAIRGGVILDFSRMNQVLAIHPEDLTAVVQPGLTRIDLNEQLRDTGLFFSVDPGANATLGGMAATRASGTTTVRYGTIRENILALETVMADGTIIRTGKRVRKSSAGYDLSHLLIGSEGTLGLITELTIRLHGIPEAILAATCHFQTIEAAVETVIETIQSGIPMARIELVDDMMVRGFNLYAESELPEKPHLFLEFHGSPSAVEEQAAFFRDIAADHGMSGFELATSTEARNALWSMRHNGHHATKMLAPGKQTLATDVCVPISRLAEAVTEARAECAARNLICAIVGHVGDGNFHCGIRFDPDDAQERASVEAFAAHLAQMALRLDGTITGEHGIGIGKQKYMAAEHGPGVAVMRQIKTALDPRNILNPGKLLPDADQ